MKIVIKKGVNVEVAVNMCSEFIKNNFENYPILKNDMNVYLTLKNSDENVCPENEQEYILSSSGCVTNVLEEKKKRAKEVLMKEWEIFLYSHKRAVEKLTKDVERDRNYIDTAKEKRRREENITKRKMQLKKTEEELESAIKSLEFVEKLDNSIKNNCYKLQYLFAKRSSYEYSLDAVFIFVDVDGYTGYFFNNRLHNGNFER